MTVQLELSGLIAMCQRLWSLVLLLALSSCAASLHYSMSDIACGAPLAEDCDRRIRTYTMLPSQVPALALAPYADGTLSPRGREARTLADRGLWKEAVPLLERMARGDFGDSLYARQSAEYYLAAGYYSMYDYGGAFDLVRLMLDGSAHGRDSVAKTLLRRWAALSCRTGPALRLLAKVHNEVLWRQSRSERRILHIGEAQTDALTARGLVEVGRDEEARVLLNTPHVVNFYPEFSAQCLQYIDARRQEQAGRTSAGPGTVGPNPNLPDCDPEPSEEPGGVIQLDEPCPSDP